MGSSFGEKFKIVTFGESHGPAIGVIIEGCPAGLAIDKDFIMHELQRRKPGQSNISSPRKEQDFFQILSGVFEGKATGSPICILIPNTDARSKDYTHLKNVFRPSHADYTYFKKYGFRDPNGGGRSSARETAARVAAGAIAKLFLAKKDIKIQAYVSQIGTIEVDKHFSKLDLSKIEVNSVRCPDASIAQKMLDLIKTAQKNKDTLGGVVTGVIRGVPVGLGEPVFDKLHAVLGKAMLSINAVKGFEYGSGFAGTSMYGSVHNDTFYREGNRVRTRSNFSGGIQGGISNGEDIYFRVAFKPVATLMQKQESIDVENQTVMIEGKGRHDPCVVPRAVPIVEAMAALVITDFYLLNLTTKL